MKAILIDPETQTISEVEYDGDYKTIHKLIDADGFTVVYIDNDNNSDAVYVDDDGLFTDKNFFWASGWSQPLAGKGLVLGTDDDGDGISPRTTLRKLKSQIKFMDRNMVDLLTRAGLFDL
jgi:hypothetical protein